MRPFGPLLIAVLLGGCSAVGSSTATPPGESSTAPAATPSSATETLGPSPAQPPFVAGTTWKRTSSGRSLRITPTASGRRAAGDADADVAWREVLRLAPDADQPGMRAQFDCHWTYARLLRPNKPTWNIEPWRPVVSPQVMVLTGCNPGGGEE